MTAPGSRGDPCAWDVRWDGRAVRVTTPVPPDVWHTVASADPSAMPFHTPAWRDCVSAASGWRDASRLYEMPGGRQLVLMLARRTVPGGLAREASWPAGWGPGGVLAPGGVRPQEVALVCADLARGRALSTTVRPGFAAAAAWSAACLADFTIPREVHVAHFGECFGDFLTAAVTAKRRAMLRTASRHLERAGVVITSGNSPALVAAFYQVYLRWIDWRARQRKVPASLARLHAQRLEPLRKFSTVASRLGSDCRIWAAWWEDRPIAATISLYAGEAAVGWRLVTDRSVPARFRLFEILAAEALRHACESGRLYLEMGESVGRTDLADIKKRLGGQEHSCAEYCFERLPLSPGRMAFQKLRRHAEDWIIGRGPRPDPRLLLAAAEGVPALSSQPVITSPVPRAAWESLVRADPNAMVSQSLAWRDAVCASGRYEDVSLFYEFPSGQQVVLPMVRHRRLPSWAAVAASWPSAWGVGGPVSRGGRIGRQQAAAVLADLEQRGMLAVQIQFRPGADGAWLSEGRRFRAERRGCHLLDLGGGFGEVWRRRFRGSARTAIRRAERSGLDVDVDRSGRLLPVFCDLHEKSIRRWAAMQHEPLPLSRWRTMRATSPAMLASVARRFGEDCAVWVASSRGEPLAAIIVVQAGGHAKYWRGAMDKERAAPLRASELLHRLAIEDACRHGYRCYDFGISRPDSGLARFKEKLGATFHVAHLLHAERLPVHAVRQHSRVLVKKVIGFRDL